MLHQPVLPQQHCQNAQPLLPGGQHIAQEHQRPRALPRDDGVHHLEHRAFDGARRHGVNVILRDGVAVARQRRQLLDFRAQQRRVIADRKGQKARHVRRALLPVLLEHADNPPVQLRIPQRLERYDAPLLLHRRIELLAPVRLAAHIDNQHARIRHFRDVADEPLFHLAPPGRAIQFPHNNQPLVRRERQRFTRRNNLPCRRILHNALVQLRQSVRQHRLAQRGQRYALDVLLHALKQVRTADLPGLQRLHKFIVIHCISSNCSMVKCPSAIRMMMAPLSSVLYTSASVMPRR